MVKIENMVCLKSSISQLFYWDQQTACSISIASSLTILTSKTLSLAALRVMFTIAGSTTFHLLVKKITLFPEADFVLCIEIQTSHYLSTDLDYYYSSQLMLSSFVFVSSTMISFSFLIFYYLVSFFHHKRMLKSLTKQFQKQILLIFRYFFLIKFIKVPYNQLSFFIHTIP